MKEHELDIDGYSDNTSHISFYEKLDIDFPQHFVLSQDSLRVNGELKLHIYGD